jgi:PTH1 family peptidyl-tRNA hydrolase
MNLSGPAVRGLVERYELTPAQLVVVYDELDLPWTAMKIKPKGSAAGHNGMKSVISSLGTNEIPRIRLGIHPGHPIRNGAEFVLAPFKRSQQKELEEVVDRGRAAVESIIAEGVAKAMTTYNRRAQGLNQEEA